jgi:hypothetical protein
MRFERVVRNSGGAMIQVHNLVPAVSSENRMHIMDESCWCKPHLLLEGGGTMKIDHRRDLGISEEEER